MSAANRDRSTSKLLPIVGRAEITRREALRLLGAGIAAAQAGCLVAPGDELAPYVADQRERTPGTPLRFASALTLDGFATGVIVETHEGRPTKLDGNPLHPATFGGSSAILQARILDLYDPQRVTSAAARGNATTWSRIAAQIPAGPLWLVMPPQTSPTVAQLLELVRERRDLHVIYDEPLGHRNAYAGHALVFGEPLEAQLDLAHADVIAAFDADWANAMPMSAAWARAAASRRDPSGPMSRWWSCEPMMTATGSLADERLAIRAGDVVAIATLVLGRLGERGLPSFPLPDRAAQRAARRVGVTATRWAIALADDLAEHRGRGGTIVGDRQPPIVHALARWIDAACGNLGGAVTLSPSARLEPLADTSLAQLAQALRTGDAKQVIIVDANPVYTAPRGLDFGARLRGAPWTLCVSMWRDETAAVCDRVVPLAHELEAWSDPRAYDGTLAFAQPVIRARVDGASVIDVLAALVGDRRGARTIIYDRWRAERGAGVTLADAAWQSALATGVVAGSEFAVRTQAPTAPAALVDQLSRALADPDDGIEIALAPSVLHDGRFAGNAWLQELPHPITKQTWGNAALVARELAEALGVDDGDVLAIATARGGIELPCAIVPGHADRAITVELGYGRDVPGLPIANGLGGDGFALRNEAGLLLHGSALRTGKRGRIVRAQKEFDPHDRQVAPIATLTAFRVDPDLTRELRGPLPTMLAEQRASGPQWAMAIDTSKCTGCSACVIACQAENNVPVVGADEVARGRHMHWLRIDTYRDNGELVHQPMLCQHCEHAPCEYVCPVEATVHSHDGLNEQVYNRCIGTRFCSNNCPYKVRRFNFFGFDEKHDSTALQRNPDVTVRGRGVMEKCTYCVQRIRRAEITARVDGRSIRIADVVTACQQACPTAAIRFGALGHEPIASARRDPRRYDVLHRLGTRPRTQYLLKIINRKRGAR
jgi:Fe-S-cluster-containing dehydrogenase component